MSTGKSEVGMRQTSETSIELTKSKRPCTQAQNVSALSEDLHTQLIQLSAMLMLTYGEGGQEFRMYNEDIQDNYMWACSDKAAICAELAELLTQNLVGNKKEVRHD